MELVRNSIGDGENFCDASKDDKMKSPYTVKNYQERNE